MVLCERYRMNKGVLPVTQGHNTTSYYTIVRRICQQQSDKFGVFHNFGAVFLGKGSRRFSVYLKDISAVWTMYEESSEIPPRATAKGEEKGLFEQIIRVDVRQEYGGEAHGQVEQGGVPLGILAPALKGGGGILTEHPQPRPLLLESGSDARLVPVPTQPHEDGEGAEEGQGRKG